MKRIFSWRIFVLVLILILLTFIIACLRFFKAPVAFLFIAVVVTNLWLLVAVIVLTIYRARRSDMPKQVRPLWFAWYLWYLMMAVLLSMLINYSLAAVIPKDLMWITCCLMLLMMIVGFVWNVVWVKITERKKVQRR